MKNNSRVTDTRTTLMDRAREWVRQNVPVHSQAEMDMLLTLNSDLMLRLISKCLDFEELLKAYRTLQFEVAKEMPQVPWKCSGDVLVRIEDLSRTYTMQWVIDPARQSFAVRDPSYLRNRLEVPEIGHAMRRYFDEVTAPMLFDGAMASLSRQMARFA